MKKQHVPLESQFEMKMSKTTVLDPSTVSVRSPISDVRKPRVRHPIRIETNTNEAREDGKNTSYISKATVTCIP